MPFGSCFLTSKTKKQKLTDWFKVILLRKLLFVIVNHEVIRREMFILNL